MNMYAYLPTCLPVYRSIYLSIYLAADLATALAFENSAILLSFMALLGVAVRKPEDPEPLAASQYPQAVPIPDIPHDSSLTFEVIMFSYVSAALGLQYLNLYR